jgi:uncharacterized protein YfaQ (DUF2300 family)
MPSQSLSLSSQISGEYWHWQTSPLWPMSGAQLQPATQLAAELQLVVQTLPVQTPSPAG